MRNATQHIDDNRRYSRPARHLAIAPDPTFELLPHVPSGRALHLVDLENLMGGPVDDPRVIASTILGYIDAAGYQTGDLMLVAVNPGLFMAVWRSCPACA